MEGPSPSPLPFSSYAVSSTEAQNATGGFVLQVNLERPLNTSWVSKYHSKGFALLVSCKTCWETMDEWVTKGQKKSCSLGPTMDLLAPSRGWATLVFIHLHFGEVPHRGL